MSEHWSRGELAPVAKFHVLFLNSHHAVENRTQFAKTFSAWFLAELAAEDAERRSPLYESRLFTVRGIFHGRRRPAGSGNSRSVQKRPSASSLVCQGRIVEISAPRRIATTPPRTGRDFLKFSTAALSARVGRLRRMRMCSEQIISRQHRCISLLQARYSLNLSTRRTMLGSPEP
jgi:hypothetical protein